jgi:MFS family permease
VDRLNKIGPMAQAPTSPPETAEASPRYPGWRVVFVCFLIATFSWGLCFYGLSVYLVEFQRLYGWSTTWISLASSAFYLASAVFVVYVSEFLRRLGPRRLMLAGMVTLAIAAVGIGLVSAPWHLALAYLVMSFAWAVMSIAAITSILGLWFRSRLGLAISLALTGASFGGILVVPALIFLTDAIGFRNAMISMAAFMLILLVPAIFALIGPPPQVETATPGTPQPVAWTRAQALRSPAFWSVCGPVALSLVAQVGFLVHQIAILQVSIGRTSAGIAVAITTVAALFGRLLLGAVADRLDPRITTAISLATQAAALFVIARTSDAAMLYVACVVFGLSVGNLITLPALIVQREFEPGSFGMLVGLLVAVSQVTYAFGPSALGALRDLTGNYTASIFLCIGAELLAAAIILWRPRSRIG